jgi:NAD(P)H-dependent FMN reductase
MFKLHVIIASTRPERVGPSVARWFHELASRHGKFEIRLVDLREVNLPLLDEPHHPRLGKYEHQHTKNWSALVDDADAYVVVTPEYNYGMAPALLNAFDFLYREWNYKPIGFVSYGGISGGMRSVQMAKLVTTTLKMMPVPEGVAIAFVGQHRDPSGVFTGSELHHKSADSMLDELLRWAEALAPLRAHP